MFEKKVHRAAVELRSEVFLKLIDIITSHPRLKLGPMGQNFQKSQKRQIWS